MILAEHTWIPTLPEWVVELQPLLVLAGLLGGVFVLWQMVLTTFEPRKRWAEFRHHTIVVKGTIPVSGESGLADALDEQLAKHLERKQEEEE